MEEHAERMTYRDVLYSDRLLASILVRAFRDLGQSGDLAYGEVALQRQQAQSWFESDRTDEGSFRWVCEGLGLDPVWILEGIRMGIHWASIQSGFSKEFEWASMSECFGK